jgi:HTH-type transcriptional regulator / antitoxin MqsA
MPGWYCHESDESIHTGEDMKVSDAALKALRIKVEHLLAPEEVKRIRQKMGLTQRQAGSIIGGGPNAFQKYEGGETVVSKGISNFLRVLERHPEEIEELKKQAWNQPRFGGLIFLARHFLLHFRCLSFRCALSWRHGAQL